MPFTPAPGKPAERCRPAVTPECSPPHLRNRWPRHAAAERTRPHDLWPAHPSTSAARPHDVEDGTLPTVGMSVTAMSSSLHVSCLRAARRRASSVFRADGGVFWRKSLVGNVRHWHIADCDQIKDAGLLRLPAVCQRRVQRRAFTLTRPLRSQGFTSSLSSPVRTFHGAFSP